MGLRSDDEDGWYSGAVRKDFEFAVEAEKLLRDLAAMDPWLEDEEPDFCALCGAQQRAEGGKHRDGCIWMRAVELVGKR